MKRLLIIGLALLTLQACKKEGCTDPTATNYNTDAGKDDGSCTYPSTNNTNNNNNNNGGDNQGTPATDSYLIVDGGDTVPLITATVNYQDTARTILQTNFKDDNHHVGISYTLTESLKEQSYTTNKDRFFFAQSGVDSDINLYYSDFKANKNYLVESGKTITVTSSGGKKEISWRGLKLTLETDSTQSITTTAKILVTF
ncbi:hypothetical protein KFE98_15850 [bacterium SCSIO 12741]|nr:hypothetical protein KFE98_15850 [bacterium SCSIO 12741]